MSNERVKPLFEDASASPELRDFVTMARSDGPTQAELDQLTRRLAPVLGVSAGVAIAGQAAAVGTAPVAALGGASSLAGAVPSSAGTGVAGMAGTVGTGAAAAKAGAGAAVASGGAGVAAVKAGLLGQLFASTSAKLVAVGLGVSVASLGAWELRRDEPSQPAAAEPGQASGPAQPLPEARTAEPVGVTRAEPVPAAVEPAPEVVAPASPPAVRAGIRPHASRPRASVQPAANLMPPVPELASLPEPELPAVVAAPPPVPSVPEAPPPSELALIRQAQAARANSGQALALLAQHQQQYPHGALAQERDVLAIEIMLKAGLKVQAQARAQQFEASYPGSAHLPHVKALIERAGAQ